MKEGGREGGKEGREGRKGRKEESCNLYQYNGRGVYLTTPQPPLK